MEKISVKMSENTLNDINTLKLTGNHRYRGTMLLAKREHNKTTGIVYRTAGIGIAHQACDEKVWPTAVQTAVHEWRQSCQSLDEANIAANEIGRELFATLITED